MNVLFADEYSSTSSSSSDYSSDSEPQCEDDSVVINDKKISTKAIRAQLYPRANRMEDPKLNNKIKVRDKNIYVTVRDNIPTTLYNTVF